MALTDDDVVAPIRDRLSQSLAAMSYSWKRFETYFCPALEECSPFFPLLLGRREMNSRRPLQGASTVYFLGSLLL